MIIGSHVSFGAEQLLGSAKQAKSFGANTFMFYTGAPQNTIRKEIDDNKTKEELQYIKKNNIEKKKFISNSQKIIKIANKEN